jgi:competence protein ComEA
MGTSVPWRALETPDEAGPAQEPRPGKLFTLLLGLAVAGLVLGSLAVVACVEMQSGGRVTVVGGPSGAVASGGSPSGAMVVVQVTGAVLRPGVYSLPAGSRVGDAIKAAGGYAPDVDPRAAETRLNQAAKLQDAESIVVPRRGDAVAGSPVTAASGQRAGPLNLNTATAAELDALPGIGPATAAKIVSSREQLRFASVNDLVSRKLVSAATLAKFRDQVSV